MLHSHLSLSSRYPNYAFPLSLTNVSLQSFSFPFLNKRFPPKASLLHFYLNPCMRTRTRQKNHSKNNHGPSPITLPTISILL